MLLALCLFVCTYLLMLGLPQYRPWIALGGAAGFLALGGAGFWEFSLLDAARAIDFNVLLMLAGTMGTVALFIESRMPLRLAEELIARVPNVKWAVSMLALFAGVISAFVDNVATVLMVAPVGLAIARKLKISPVPVLTAIAVSSNLQGAATLVGDTTSILLGGFAEMNFFDFFWMQGRPGIFWGVELGALASLGVLFFLFRKETQPIRAAVETTVEDPLPTVLMPPVRAAQRPALRGCQPVRGDLHLPAAAVAPPGANRLPGAGSGHAAAPAGAVRPDRGRQKGRADRCSCAALLRSSGRNVFRLYTLIVLVSVVLSAFVDNIPYVATMLPVVQEIAARMNGGSGMPPELFYFGLLTGATLGGNLTPIGASANIAAIGILRRNGEAVRTRDFLRIGVPFTLAAVLSGYGYLWLVWGS